MTNNYSFKSLEDKWIKKWKKNEVFNVEREEGKKSYFVNVAYPYPSGSMHVGHGRTYTLPDIIARYKRMCGYNVLFPMGWHVTGTPVIGISRRIQEKDENTLEIYKNLYGVPEEKIEDFEDPLEIVDYFSSEYKEVMTRLGYSIDWNREFKTVDDEYNSFIQWQYRRLREKDLIEKGTHPVKYCPNDKNALGDHDLLEGESADIDEFYLIKFKLTDNVYLPCATLRPETVFGATNLWIKPEGNYAKIDVGEEKWIVSIDAVEKLKHQNFDVELIEEIKGKELIGRETENRYVGKVPILKASFVDLDVATGVVMSVPAHAPYDLIALKDLDSEIEAESIIDLEGYREIPAQRILNEFEISDQSDPKLEDATEELYNKEFNMGNMSSNTGKYANLSVKEARQNVGEDLINEGLAETMYEFNEKPVICRCGTEAVVKVLKDQWFIDYSNQMWKDETKKAVRDMDLVPEGIEKDFNHSIDWLEEWACTRRVGLGTKLPWDQEWLIEPLSDSTIYMSYYTVSKILKEIDGEPSDELFDYIFQNKGEIEDVSEKTGIDVEKIKKMKSEFAYWYPYDFRFSAKDLIPNHLTFQLFHHTALFDKEKWPKGISVLGMGLLEGKKMSSSKGHVVLLKEAVEKYGADTVRFFLAENAEPWQDFDWREKDVKSTNNKLMHFWDNIEKYISFDVEEKNLKPIDRWLLSRFNKKIEKTKESLEKHQTRKALQNAFYLLKKDLGWYKKRTTLERDGAKYCLNKISKQWIKLLAPFIPFIAEEVWSKIGEGFVSEQNYPAVDEELFNNSIELKERIIEKVENDIGEIIDVTKSSPNKIYLYTPKKWKKELLKSIVGLDELNRGNVMNKVMQKEEFRKRGEKVNDIISELIKIIREFQDQKDLIPKIELDEILDQARKFYEKEFDCEIKITSEKECEHDPQNKAKNALPLKPAIYLE